MQDADRLLLFAYDESLGGAVGQVSLDGSPSKVRFVQHVTGHSIWWVIALVCLAKIVATSFTQRCRKSRRWGAV